ncbi:MAG TPA: nucleotidyltransferase domain-containing protein [Caulobacteraceae bacterium]|nr:nucleotidyltransferase domain-containing protein [Caulobacteraceae bacterium]
MPTPAQQQLTVALTRLIETTPAVEAAWLAGSLGRGGGDAFSDVDLLVLVADGGLGAAAEAIAAKLAQEVTPVLINRLYGGRVLNVVTDDWQRFDLSFIEASDLPRYNVRDLQVLFNHACVAPPDRPPEAYSTEPALLLGLVQEFLRVLGMLPGALGREEYEIGLRGIDLLRGMTMDLFLEENGVSPAARGGALRRNPFFTADQRAELARIPPLGADGESLIVGCRALAAIFLPRARRLAGRIGMEWPAALEAAVRRRLKQAIGEDLLPPD